MTTKKRIRKDYWRKRSKQRRERITAMKRELGPCKYCPKDHAEGEPCCLDFHHIDPSQKDYEIHSIAYMCMERILEEMSKCVLVCKNCHAKIHAGLITVKPEDRVDVSPYITK